MKYLPYEKNDPRNSPALPTSPLDGSGLRRLSRLLIGEAALEGVDLQVRHQAMLASVTAALGILAATATLIFGWGFFSLPIKIVCLASISIFCSFFVVYRLIPRLGQLANNLIPLGLTLTCGFAAIHAAGLLPVAAIYAPAIPLLTMMICRTREAYFWSALMCLCLLIGMFSDPHPVLQAAPGWVSLAAGVTILIAALVSLRLHRFVWETALQDAREANRELRVNHDQQRVLDQRLYNQERIESLGLMAGGVAHDFNNFLTVIIGNTSLIRYALEQREMGVLEEHLDSIDHAAEDAGELSQQLLDYTGHRHQTLIRFDAAKRLTSAIAMAQASVPVGTAIDLQNLLPIWIEGDPIQFDQVLVNLIRNAAQAYSAGDGTVQVKLQRVEVSTPLKVATSIEPLPPGVYARVTVKDLGRGIAPQYLDQLFDPFFSTREDGRGLGLASVQGISVAHGGGVSVSSTPHVGTTMQLWLPEATQPQQEDVHLPVLSRFVPSTNKAMLIADDQAGVREVLHLLLSKFGFKTGVARDGQAALDEFKQNDYAAIVLDISMPKLDGLSTLESIRKQDPQFPVLLISGFNNEFTHELLRNDSCVRTLKKPFSAAALGVALSELGVLERR